MNTVYEVKEHNVAELKVTIDGEQWQAAKKKAYAKAASNLEVKGFRKGHVPAAMAKKYISDEAVMWQAGEDSLQQAFQYGMEQNPSIRPVAQPAAKEVKPTEDSCELVFELIVYPEVKLGDYKSAKYEVKAVEVTEDEVKAEIERLQKQHSEEILKEEGTVENGDIAVINFEGFVDGVAFEGGKGTEYPLTIGSGSFIPGFEEQIIGMATEEEKDINVTFPTEYAPELAGKDATFKVKVCAVKTNVLPEVNDDFVADLEKEGVTTVEQLTDSIKAEITERKTKDAEEDATNALLEAVESTCEVEIPDAMIDSEVEDTVNQYAQRLAQQGIQMDMYYQITGSNEEMFKQQVRPDAEKKVRIRVILEAIANDLGINPTDEEVEEQYNAMATQYGMEAEQIKKLVPAEYLRDDVKMQKTLETLKKGTIAD